MKTCLTPLLLTSLFAVSVSAQDRALGAEAAARAPGGDRRPGGRMAPTERIMGGGDIEQNMLLRLLDNPRIAEEIKLTEEQRTVLTDVLKEYDEQLEAYRPKLDQAIQVQTGLLGELKPDEAKLMEAVEAAWKIRTEIAKIQTRKLLALRSHLTVDQINRAKEMMDGFRERMQAFRERGGEGGQRPEGGFRGPRPEGGEGGQRPEGGFRGPRPEGGFRGQRPEGGFRGDRPANAAPRAPRDGDAPKDGAL